MELKSALKKLENSEEFENWNNKNKDSFFSYAFKMLEGSNSSPWQLGFYHKTTDKLTTFTIEESEIKMQQEEDIFKEPDVEVMRVDIKNAKIPFKKILKKAVDFQKKKYPNELVSKTIAILQNLEEYGTIWNITYVMHSFKTLNLKINPENGKITSYNLESLMNFIKK